MAPETATPLDNQHIPASFRRAESQSASKNGRVIA